MMLVAGFSGIGKTAVVNEVHKPIVRQRGYFIKGKYDLFQRNHKLEEYSHTLEQKVEERTQEITEKATQLESTLEKLYSTQAQLIQSEKMSGLGQLVARIAHEINNPINFIYGNLQPASEYVTSLIELNNLYQELYPQPLPEISEKSPILN